MRLDASLLEADSPGARARPPRRTCLERLRLTAREFFAEEVTTPQEYDNIRFTVKALEQRVAATRAEAARIERIGPQDHPRLSTGW